ncbi:uncharacterized protein [Diadema antillarum]|uniref:uncharacterized protein n=1 Tax=Diadema antillarum TaxID=105358 RepID=UPI003A89E546
MFYLVAVNSSRHAKTDLVALIANIMTMWKTVLYLLMYTPLARGTHLLGTDDPVKLVFLFAIPNGIWILLPALGALQLFNRILERLTATPVVVKQTKRKPKQY